MVGEQVVQCPGQQHDGGADAGDKGSQEAEVVILPSGHWAAREEGLNGAPAEVADGIEKLLVDAGDEGYGTSADTGDKVCGAHGHAAQSESDPGPGVAAAHVRRPPWRGPLRRPRRWHPL